MALYKEHKQKKELPKERGEKWALKDGSSVIVLGRQGKGFVRCFGETGFIKIIHDNQFDHREKAL